MRPSTSNSLQPGGVPPVIRYAWLGALACFVLAGLTGALYRFGIAYGLTFGLDLVNIRHAHSHMMYFGWATPALMALVVERLPAVTGRPLPGGMRWVLAGIFSSALLAYPLFLAFGYTPVALGTKQMPVAVIGSSFNVLFWYAFVWPYVRATRGVQRTRALLLWDLALTFLCFATLGAWGLALLKPLGIHDPAWASGLTHIFLDLFSEGWFVLGVLGLVYAWLDPWQAGVHWSVVLLAVGLPVTFALGMPELMVPPGLKTLARAGGALVGTGLLGAVVHLWRCVPREGAWWWRLPLLLLALRALAGLSVSLVPGVWWASEVGLRILYLHVMLLGFVTLGLVAVASAALGRRYVKGMPGLFAAVVLLLFSLLPLTSLWPAVWHGRWVFYQAAWVALGPALAMVVMLARGLRSPGSAPADVPLRQDRRQPEREEALSPEPGESGLVRGKQTVSS